MAGLLAFSAPAAPHSLPTPPPSTTVDTESSVLVPLNVDTNANELVVSFDFTPSPTNALFVALGSDRDADGELSFDETDIRLGYDCGSWFRKEGLGQRSRPNLWTHAQVTTYGPYDSNTLVRVKFRTSGILIMIK